MHVKRVAAVLLVCAHTALGAVAFGPERPVADPVIDPAPLAQLTPRIASNGDGFATVWVDTRAGSNDIVAALLDAAGNLLPSSATGVPIATGATTPAIAWVGGRRYLIVYAVRNIVYSIPLYVDGHTGPAQQVFGSGSAGLGAIEIASNGSTALLVTSAGMALLDEQGSLIKRLTAPQTPVNKFVSVRTDGDDYIVSVIDSLSNLVVQRVTNSGAVTTLSNLPVPGTTAITSAGDLIVVTANENIISIPTNHGVISGQAVVAKSFVTTTPWPVASRLITQPNGYQLVFARGGGDQLFVALNASGQAIDPQRNLGKSADGARADIASNGGRSIAVWSERPGRLAAAVAGTSGVSLLPPIARSAHAELSPHTAVAGLNALTLWTEVVDGTRGELRIGTANGTTRTVVTSDSIITGDVASDGTTVWVWWIDSGTIKVRRFTSTLDAIDAEPFIATLGPVTQAAGAAGNGALLLVVRRQVGGEGDIDAILVGAAGSVSAFPVTTEIFDDRDPDVAWSGTDFVAAWIHAVGPAPGFGQPRPTDEVLTSRISRDGVVISGPIQVININSYITAMRVDAIDNEAAIAFQQEGSNDAVFGTIFTAPPSPTAFAQWVGGERVQLRDLARNGNGYVLLTTSDDAIETRDIARTSEASAPVIVATLDRMTPDPAPDIAFSGAAGVIAYVRRVDGPDYGGVPRVFFRATPVQRLRAVRR